MYKGSKIYNSHLRVLLLRVRDGQLTGNERLEIDAGMLARRRKVFCFLYRVEFSGPNGGIPAAGLAIQQLGYPQYNDLKESFDEVREEHPELAQAYKWAFREHREATKRRAASLNLESWFFYRRRAAYLTLLERKRGDSQPFLKLEYKYRLWQLHTREKERERAETEIMRALEKIQVLRRILFERYEIPEEFRHLA